MPPRNAIPRVIRELFPSYLSEVREIETPDDDGTMHVFGNLLVCDATPRQFTRNGRPNPAFLDDLGEARLMSFQRFGRPQDLEEAISAFRSAVQLTPDSHSSKPHRLYNLADARMSRFDRFGKPQDCEEAILDFSSALQLAPDSHPDKLSWCNTLGNARLARFEWYGKLKDLEDAISYFRSTVELVPDGHEEKPFALSNLGYARLACFKRSGELQDLEEAISILCSAVQLTPDSDPSKPWRLSYLGYAHWVRCQQFGGQSQDFEETISIFRSVVRIAPDSDPDKTGYLNNLGGICMGRFLRFGETQALEEAISIFRLVVQRSSDSHPFKPPRLFNLGNAFWVRFHRFGEPQDLEEAISSYGSAVQITPDGHPDKPLWLNGTAIGRFARFTRFRESQDLEEAISIFRTVMKLTPDGKPTPLSDLGDARSIRFERFGEPKALKDAISIYASSVHPMLDIQPEKPFWLTGLGNACLVRFEQFGELQDLEDAIFIFHSAVQHTPDGHPEKPGWLCNLGDARLARFRQFRELEDLEEAVSFFHTAVQLTPDDHAMKPSRLYRLGDGHLTRFKRLGEPQDLKEAISLTHSALQFTLDDDAHKPRHFNSMASAYLLSFFYYGDLNDLDAAISNYCSALELFSDDDPYKAVALFECAHSHFLRAVVRRVKVHTSGVPDASVSDSFDTDLRYVGALLKNAATISAAKPSIRFQSIQNWLKCCAFLEPFPDARPICEAMFELIPRLVWLGQSVNRRLEKLPEIGEAVAAAVSLAIASGEMKLAIEWFEAGRSIVWGQLLQLRTPIDELREVNCDLADRLQLASERLESSSNRLASAQPEDSLSLNRTLLREGGAEVLRKLAREYECVLAEIRAIEGFEDFLRPKRFEELSCAARDGPVVLVNIHEQRCDALVVCRSSRIIHIPLPQLSANVASKCHKKLSYYLTSNFIRAPPSSSSVNKYHADRKAGNVDKFTRKRLLKVPTFYTGRTPCGRQERVRKASERGLRVLESQSSDGIKIVLRALWKCVASPILDGIKDVLTELTADAIPHVTWCMTGPLALLPIHAAGVYDEADPIRASDFIVSSYTPSLSMLLRRPSHNLPRKVLVVTQANTPDHPELPGTLKEIAVIERRFKGNCTSIRDEDATISVVLEALDDYPYVHFACHGIQDPIRPLDSAFELHDGSLTIRELMAKSLKNAELAVLSACQTAKGDESMPEEAMHLAAGMLAIGFRSVVGTMWSIGDDDGPIIAKAFYRSLLRSDTEASNGSESDSHRSKVAYAMHDAVCALKRKVGETNFIRWVPFVHYGL